MNFFSNFDLSDEGYITYSRCVEIVTVDSGVVFLVEVEQQGDAYYTDRKNYRRAISGDLA